MVKSELIKALASRMTYLPERTVEEAVNLILACMSQALVNGQRQACRQFLRNLPGPPSPRKGQKLATSMPPAALDVLVPLDLDPHAGLKIYAPQ